MTPPRILVALATVALASLAVPAATSAQKPAEPPEWAAQFGGASLAAVWQGISAASERIDRALAAGKLEGIAASAETIHLGAHALQDQVKVGDAARAKRLHGALGQAARIADDLLDAAEHNKADLATEAHRRLKSALAVVARRLPPEIVAAAK